MRQRLYCHRCGACCTWTYKGQYFRCKYLIGDIPKDLYHPDTTTSCSIYENRLGIVLYANEGLELVCKRRNSNPIQIAGCTMNKIKKEEK